MDRESFPFFFSGGRVATTGRVKNYGVKKKKKIQTADVLNIGQLIGVLS